MKILLTILFLISYNSYAQQTVGLFLNEEESFNGYTLFAPISSTETFLIDNCGEKVHSWVSVYQTGHSCYLLENGVLLRAGRQGNITDSPGLVEMIDWDGNVIWSHSVIESHGRQHHDIEMLPNGNILLIVWDERTHDEVTQAGSSTTRHSIFSEQIVEIEPDLENDTAIVVWEWKLWDHLIQDADSSKDNYGVVSEHPERININYVNNNILDPFHANSVDYHAEFDQIVFSPRTFNELWIIDHSTTTAEAAASSGGRYGQGGDLLYRWGNPHAYDQGLPGDQKLFRQHNTNWIEDGFLDEGKIILFNNRAGTLDSMDYSTVDVVNTPVDENGFYTYNGGAYGPLDFDWTYKAPEPTDFFSNIISGAERLENGNTLICDGVSGRFFEVDYEGDIVWEYVNPVTASGPLAQGEFSNGVWVFRCSRYGTEYPAFDGRTLTPTGYLETGSTFTCEIIPEPTATAIDENIDFAKIQIFPNPVSDFLTLALNSNLWEDKIESVRIYNSMASLVYSSDRFENLIDVRSFDSGVYFIQFIIDGKQIARKVIVN